jgi:hypothetical protein
MASSSLLEVACEALERMTPEGGETYVQIVCNSCLNPLDVQAAREVKWWDRIRFILEDRKYAGNPGGSVEVRCRGSG